MDKSGAVARRVMTSCRHFNYELSRWDSQTTDDGKFHNGLHVFNVYLVSMRCTPQTLIHISFGFTKNQYNWKILLFLALVPIYPWKCNYILLPGISRLTLYFRWVIYIEDISICYSRSKWIERVYASSTNFITIIFLKIIFLCTYKLK